MYINGHTFSLPPSFWDCAESHPQTTAYQKLKGWNMFKIDSSITSTFSFLSSFHTEYLKEKIFIWNILLQWKAAAFLWQTFSFLLNVAFLQHPVSLETRSQGFQKATSDTWALTIVCPSNGGLTSTIYFRATIFFFLLFSLLILQITTVNQVKMEYSSNEGFHIISQFWIS